MFRRYAARIFPGKYAGFRLTRELPSPSLVLFAGKSFQKGEERLRGRMKDEGGKMRGDELQIGDC